MFKVIQFQQHPDPGYALRTLANAKAADLTIAFAIDFNSAGEILTRKCAYGKYYAVDLKRLYTPIGDIQKMADMFERKNIRSVNVAGNGIYTLDKHGITQNSLNDFMEDYFGMLIEVLGREFSIRSGGQTGSDMAGNIAADKLGLQTICLAPKGWLYRDINGKDIRNEVAFKKRFGEGYDLSFIF